MEVADMAQRRRSITADRQDTGSPYSTSAATIDTVTKVNPFEVVGDRINPNGPGGCWIWTGPTDEAGYGHTGVYLPGQFTDLVHRVTYQMLVGPIPEDHVIHHECEVKACCNPAHLTPMTNSDHLAHHVQLRRAS